MPSIRYCTVDRTEHHEDTVYVSWFSTHTFPPYKWCTAAPALFLHQAEPTRACTTTELPPQLRPHWLPYFIVLYPGQLTVRIFLDHRKDRNAVPLYSSPHSLACFSHPFWSGRVGSPGGKRQVLWSVSSAQRYLHSIFHLRAQLLRFRRI